MRRRSTCAMAVCVGAGLLLPGTIFGGRDSAPLGAVTIDKTAAEVLFQDSAEDREYFVVTVRGVRPKEAARVRTNRVKVWLLRDSFFVGGPALAVADRPRGEFLPERAVDAGLEFKAAFTFTANGLRREHMIAVVVAIDGDPKLFKLSRPAK